MESFYHEFGMKIYNNGVKHGRTPRYVRPGPEIGDGSHGIPANETGNASDLVIVETILPPRLPSQFFRRRPVFIVEHIHASAGEENQDTNHEPHTPKKRPVRHKEGGFKFKPGS